MKLPSITRVRCIFGSQGDVAPGLFASVTIASGKRDVVFFCNPATDEIRISSRKSTRKPKNATVFVRGSFRVEWIWALKNQKGYDDGFRIQLGQKNHSRVFEIVSIASSLEVHEAFMLPNQSSYPAPASGTSRAQHESRLRGRG